LDSVPFATAREDAPVYQLGVARRVAGLRLGGAYAWSVLGDRLRTARAGGEEERTRSEFLNLIHHEASLGLGWGDGAATVDLVAELRWERLDDRFRELTESSTSSTFRVLRRSDLAVDGDVMPGIATRASVPLGSWLRVVAFGSYRELTFDVVQTIRVETESSSGVSVVETSEYVRDRGHSWSAGASLEVGERWRLALHGFWESEREPARHNLNRLDPGTLRSEAEALRLGVSGAHELGLATTVHAGWSMTERDSSQVQENEFLQTTFTTGDQSRTVLHEFGWGATHTFWLLDLTGSATHGLSLGNLFLRIDLRARF
jgi:hypothetical protein